MHVSIAIVWCLAVAVSFVGYGLALLRCLHKDQLWLTAATAGIGLLTFFLGIMNLLGAIKPQPMTVLVVVGGFLFLFVKKRPPSLPPLLDSARKDGLAPKAISCLAFVLAACLSLTGLHSHIVNYFDDPQAYFTYPVEALQTGSLQPQPFSERRINTSLGANYLLDALLAIPGDVRSIGFLDQSLGYILYLAAIWEVARRLDLSFGNKGLLLGLAVILPLVEVNAAPVYLQSALAISLLLLMHEATKNEGVDWRNALLAGLVASALCLTKSSGIVFAVLLIAVSAFIFSLSTRKLTHLQNAILVGITAVVATLPWTIQQHRNEGTYLSPLLGRGFHASHWGVLPLPRQTATFPAILMVALPDVAALLLATLLAWRLRSRSRNFHLSLFAFALATLVATPLIAYSTAGEALDRFSFPFQIPTLIMVCALLLAFPVPHSQPPSWRRAAQVFLFIWTLAIVAVSAKHYSTYSRLVHRLEDTFTGRVKKPFFDELVLTDQTILQEKQRALAAQNTIEPGEPILEATLYAYLYDFRRNKVFIADFPGLAGWAPGIPVGRGPEPVRNYLLAHKLYYFVCDRRLTYNNEDIGDFLRNPILDATWHDLISHRIHHEIFPWSRMEWTVSRDVRHNLWLLAETNKRLYDDGTLVVVGLRSNQ